MFLFVVIFGISITRSMASLSWSQESSPLLPEAMINMNVGYNSDTDSIWLIGDGSWLIEYNITSNNYTMHDIADGFSPYSQSYTQRGTVVYRLPDHYWFIHTFDVSSQIYRSDVIEWNGAAYPCLTHSDNYLFALGGVSGTSPNQQYVTDFTIYNFQTNQWMNGTSLLYSRIFASCNVVNNKLYLIGGYNLNQSYLNSVHMINVDDVQNMGLWLELNDTLSTTKKLAQSVVYGDYIYVLGGFDITDGILNDVDIIDSTTNSISFDSSLIEPVYSHGAIVADKHLKIFVFGGYIHLSTKTNKMQYAALPSLTTPSPNTTLLTTSSSATSSLTTSSATTTLSTSQITSTTSSGTTKTSQTASSSITASTNTQSTVEQNAAASYRFIGFQIQIAMLLMTVITF